MLGMNVQRLADVARRVWSPASMAFDWWSRELTGLVPGPVHEWVAGRTRPVVIHVASNEIHLDGVGNAPTALAAGGDQQLPPAISARIKDMGCVLLLPASAVLRRTLELPIAAESEIVAAAAFLVHHVTPFTLEQVYYSCTPVARDRARRIISVEMTVVPIKVVASWAGKLRKNELSVSAIRIEGDGRTLPLASPIGTVPGAARRRSWYREPWKRTLAAAMALLVGVPFLVAKQMHAEAESLRLEVAEAKNASRQIIALRDEVDALSNAATFLPRRLTRPSPLDVLAELTRLLPDDAWFFDVSLTAGEVRAAGFSATVPTVLESLQAARCFDAPELLGPVVHGSGRDSFEIKMKIVRPAS